jgi:hypothetical protein
VSRAAGLLAVAIFGAVASVRFGSSLTRRLAELPVPPGVRQLLSSEEAKLAGATLPSSLPQDLRAMLRAAIDLSFVEAVQLVMLLAAALTVAGSVSAWGLIEGKRWEGGKAVRR